MVEKKGKLKVFSERSESFTAFFDEGLYYVDKTGFIRYLIEENRRILVFTRPRRFGKTTMHMTLKTFFEYRLDKDGNPVDNRHYFEGLNVTKGGDKVMRHLGQYPVMYLSLKDVKSDTIEGIQARLGNVLSNACSVVKDFVLKSNLLSEHKKAEFNRIVDKVASVEEMNLALGNICEWLKIATGRDTVILLDEYDVPLQYAALHDQKVGNTTFYNQVVTLVGSFMSSGFKTNPNLAFGIISGCMRVAKESVFTGMNNPGFISVLNDIPDEYWGFTESDVKTMLHYYDLDDRYENIKDWYEGYYYSQREVFNPLSVLSAVRALVNKELFPIKSYWVRTSSNDIIEELLIHHPDEREILGQNVLGDNVWVPLYDDITYRDLKIRPDSIWTMLLHTGYLKTMKLEKEDNKPLMALVKIPNKEINDVMNVTVKYWWEDIQVRQYNTQLLIKALIEGDCESVEDELSNVLLSGISMFDYKEDFYHGMLVGLLSNGAQRVKSNDEYGEGRPDIVAVFGRNGVIIEVKCVTPKALADAKIEDDDLDAIEQMMAKKLDEAEKQVNIKKYVNGVRVEYPTVKNCMIYAICFCRKLSRVRVIKE